METNTQYPSPQGFLERNNTMIKGSLIGFLILIMLIPAAFLSSLVNERKSRQEQVVKEISDKWGAAQTLTGPVLMVPYYHTITDDKGNAARTIQQAYFLPDQLDVQSRLQPEVRHRSLYDVTLYRSDIELKGRFLPPDSNKIKLSPEDIIWQDARLILGIDDMRGLEEVVTLTYNNQNSHMESGLPDNHITSVGIHAPLVLQQGTPIDFTIRLKLKGSEHLYFTPVGKTTTATMTAPWKDPSFDGQYLPSETPDISGSGFTAQWKILEMSRNYPQAWKDKSYDIRESASGVRLIQPTDSYVKTERSVKYALLFITLTFTVFFLLEILQKKRVHPLQYILVGMALCIFYTLLLSISEYTGFNPAYLIAATATTLLVGLYVRSMFRSNKTAGGFTAALGLLYTYIFILIQLQDYALLFGSIGLFAILAALMYYSRKVDWYHTGKNADH